MNTHNQSNVSSIFDNKRLIGEEGISAMNNPDTFVPSHLRSGILRFIEEGVLQGGFLSAVYDNDLTAACVRADAVTKLHIPTIVKWMINYAPAAAWGTPAKANKWADIMSRTMIRAGR